jgi:hypothetical protein
MYQVDAISFFGTYIEILLWGFLSAGFNDFLWVFLSAGSSDYKKTPQKET